MCLSLVQNSSDRLREKVVTGIFLKRPSQWANTLVTGFYNWLSLFGLCALAIFPRPAHARASSPAGLSARLLSWGTNPSITRCPASGGARWRPNDVRSDAAPPNAKSKDEEGEVGSRCFVEIGAMSRPLGGPKLSPEKGEGWGTERAWGGCLR
jgi:hypothetical protein